MDNSDYEPSTFAAMMASEKKAESVEKKSSVRRKDIKISSKQDILHTDIQDSNNTDLYDYIRGVVRNENKELSPLRISAYEKDFIVDVVYALKKKYKIKSDQTLITRIALVYMLSDFKANGKESILVKSLERIKA